MERSVLVDAGFLVALLSRRDRHHHWAVEQARHAALPWNTCEAVLSEVFHLLGSGGEMALEQLLRRSAVVLRFDLGVELVPVLDLMRKYRDVPMGLADACLVRMTEILSGPVVLTTDTDFRHYRRHSRQIIPTLMP